MQLHQLKPKTKRKKKKRVGRGGKRGTYSGRGMKGQKSRAGAKLQPAIRQFIKRYPKLRGYRFKGRKKKVVIVNIGDLEKRFKKDEKINPQALLKKGLISKMKGRIPEVKILGKGKINEALVVEGCQISRGAKEIIEKAGGKIELRIKN